MKFLPCIVVRSHHSDVALHTHQAQEQGLDGGHRRFHENHQVPDQITLPQAEVGNGHRQLQVEEEVRDGHMEGEEVSREDPGSFGPGDEAVNQKCDSQITNAAPKMWEIKTSCRGCGRKAKRLKGGRRSFQ